MLFHHLFLQTIDDIGNQVVATGYYTLEFQSEGAFHHLYIRFWHSGQLVRVYLKRTVLTQGKTFAELGLISSLVGAISTRPDIVACLWCGPDTVSLLDICKYQQHGVQSPFRFDCLSVKDLMNKKSYSVFGRIDFISVLQYLIVSLGGCTSQEWTLTTTELTKVRNSCWS